MEKINLEEIFDGADIPFVLEGYKKTVIRLMREACNQVIDLCADNAEMTGICYGNNESISDYEVDKDSILKVKEMIK